MTSEPSVRRVRLDASTRREMILAAAREQFAQHRYERVSIDTVAAAVGVTRPNVHYFFKTKQDLFLAVVERFAQFPDQDSVFAPTTALSDPHALHEAVAATIGRWLGGVERNREIYIAMAQARANEEPAIAQAWSASTGLWEVRLSRLVGFSPDVPAHGAIIRGFQSLVAALTLSWLLDAELTRDGVERALIAALIALAQTARGQAAPTGAA